MNGGGHRSLSAAPLNADEAAAVAQVLHAIADKTRVAIVSAVLHAPDGELHGRALQELLGLRQPTASHHLRKLVRAGILTREKRGPYAYYRIEPEAFARLRAIFAD
jgi:ArsR family transcriptional regulator